jgi:uncharacterized protein YndB with AHSA1/START domain
MKNLELNITTPYPVEKVWRAISEPALMSRWLMETDFKPEVGRKFKFKGKPSKFWRGWVDCKVTNIEPLKLVQFTWQNSEKHTPTLVTYTLEKTDTGTRIHATNEGFDATYGAFSGLFFRTMIRLGMNVEFKKKLPDVLAELPNATV